MIEFCSHGIAQVLWQDGALDDGLSFRQRPMRATKQFEPICMERDRNFISICFKRKKMYSVCIFCGSSSGNDPRYAEAARAIAQLLAQKGCRIVFGGGNVGLMAVVADAALGAGGQVVGVAPKLLLEREVVHRGLTELHVVETTNERKLLMMRLADAFVALPGGYGTLDELFEVLTLRQLQVHDKPCGLLNVAGFFEPLAAYLDHTTANGFLRPVNRKMLVMDADPRALLTQMGVA